MLDKEHRAAGLSRRNFLQTLAIAGGTAALVGNFGCAPNSPTDTSGTDNLVVPEEQVYQCVCPGDCGGACPMNVHVRDGKVVKTSVIELDSNDPLLTRVCQRGLTHAQRIYAPERIKYPMKRSGERGADQWEQITWDEAVDEICSKWKKSQEDYGKTSVAFCAGTGNGGPEQYYVSRLQIALGASKIMKSDDMNGLYMAALMVTRGAYLHGNSVNSILDSKNIFMWGNNASTSNHVKWSYVQAAIDKGAKLVVIDPNYTLAAAKADKWVPIRPATDGALIMAMTNIIIDEGLADIEYLTKGTVAPFLVKESDGKYLRYSDIGLAMEAGAGAGLVLDGSASTQAAVDDGSNPIVVMGKNNVHGSRDEIADPVIEGSFTIEGYAVKTAYTLLRERISEWSPEKASELCEVPVDTIFELARWYADGPTMLHLGFGMDHWVVGPYPYQALLTMAFVAGNFGKPGASITGCMGGSSMGLVGVNVGAAMAVPDAVPGPTVYSQKLTDILETGKWGETDLTIRCVFSYMGNPVAGLPARNSFLKFLDSVEFFVVADSVMNDTVQMADIVLPAAHWFEVETFHASNQPFAKISEQAITPLYEAKSDLDIANLLGAGMGIGDKMNMTADDFHSICMDNDTAKEIGLSWENLKEKKNIQILPSDYIFGENFTLPTPTGKAEFYFENVTPMMSYGQTLDTKLLSLPHWESPYEAWSDNPLYEKYPLTVMTHRDKARVNSMFCYAPWLEEIFPEPTIDLNPVEAETRGIKTGDSVKAYNDRGYVVMRARVNPAIRPGVIDTARPSNADRYIDGHYSTLPSYAYNLLVCSNGYNDTLCQVEKV